MASVDNGERIPLCIVISAPKMGGERLSCNPGDLFRNKFGHMTSHLTYTSKMRAYEANLHQPWGEIKTFLFLF